ncbi:MAG TPA: two pore domain potassium channel family protein [Opitutae bacterium]|nr:two pore domain potassium channel family protein [Opitutae bacterium]
MLTVITFRYWVMGRLKDMLPDEDVPHSHFLQSTLVLILLVCAHVVEILWFAGGFYISAHWLQLGELGPSVGNAFMDFFYHSAVTYSSLGLSEIPSGHLRFMTAMESLTGIIILTWSATFFYSVMGRQR